MVPGQSEVEVVELFDHGFDGKILKNELAAALAEFAAESGIGGELQDARSERGQVSGRDEKTGLVVEADFGGAIAIVGDDRASGGEGLRKGAREAFASGQ